jgi:hypothetical protein
MVPPVEALAQIGPERNGSAAAITTPEATTLRERVAGPVELPAEPWPGTAVLGGIAVAIAGLAIVVAALALGLWLAGDGAGGNEAGATDADTRLAIGLLSNPATERVPLARTNDAIVLAVGTDGLAALVLDGLAPAPTGKAFEAWVVEAGGAPVPAAVFSGVEGVVPLSRSVPSGATVAVTVESADGVDAPTKPLRLVATRGQ